MALHTFLFSLFTLHLFAIIGYVGPNSGRCVEMVGTYPLGNDFTDWTASLQHQAESWCRQNSGCVGFMHTTQESLATQWHGRPQFCSAIDYSPSNDWEYWLESDPTGANDIRVCSGGNCCDTYCSNPNGACNDGAKTSCYGSACDNTRDPWGNSIPSSSQSGCYGCDCSGRFFPKAAELEVTVAEAETVELKDDESTALDEESEVGQRRGRVRSEISKAQQIELEDDESTALHEESAVGQHPGATGQYCMMQRHIGCQKGSWNVGYLGRPKDFLWGSDSCTSGGEECVKLGERACENMSACWGFAVHAGWGVQMYDSNAATCSGMEGLQANDAWTTYKKGTCICNGGQAGYEVIANAIGCHSGSQNWGYLGRPKDYLVDVDYECTSGGQECIDLGERACSFHQLCWGYAVHAGWGVQLYKSAAADPSVCSGLYGLQENMEWTTYRKYTCFVAEAETNSLAMSIVTPGEASSVVLHGLAAVGLLTTLYTVGRKFACRKSDKYEEIADDV